MNAKTAKLLRRFAVESGQDYHGLKELWMHTPSAFRVELRQSIKTDIANGNQNQTLDWTGLGPSFAP